jgi:sialidase-1
MYQIWLFFLVCFLGGGLGFAQPKDNSTWKGFERNDFMVSGYKARLIKPAKAAPGKPWLWRARFPDWHTQIDSLLLTQGYHIAYVNTNDMYGSPKAMKVWDEFYAKLMQLYELHEKVALSGVSRGGLFVYNWAKANPDKVACIYAEAPVCDFKSWPLGSGKGIGSPSDWKKLKQEYGFKTEKEALNYADIPLNGLAVLAKAHIPVLHTVSTTDEVVPYAENTQKLLTDYVALGGPITIVPCTRNLRLHGHHFTIDEPGYIVDFITYHSQKKLPLSAAKFHNHRNGLKNSRLVFERGKEARVAFLGGSITYNPGWRDSVTTYLKKRFPQTVFEFIEAGIPSMGSTPSSFRLKRDVLSTGRIDLLFVEAAVNDAANRRSAKEQVRAMEGLVRNLRRNNAEADILMMHFVDPDKMARYREGKTPEVIQNHEKVAEYYGVPSLNLAKEVTERIDKGEFSWEKDFQNLHPSPFGQGVYARSIIRFLDDAYTGYLDADDKVQAYNMPPPLDRFNYQFGELIGIEQAKWGKGWSVDSNWQPTDTKGTRANYVHVPMLISNTPGAKLRFRFQGRAVGIAIAAGPDAGLIEFRIDGGSWQQQDLYTPWSKHLHLPWFYTLAAELEDDAHELEIRLVTDPANERKVGACRIRYFFVNGNVTDGQNRKKRKGDNP